MHDGCSSTGHRLRWLATYQDGSQLPECDGNECHVFGQIELDRLASFALISADDPDTDQPVYLFPVTEDTVPIFFRRYRQELNSGEPWQEFSCIGFKKRVADHVVKVYQFISPTGSTLLTDTLNAF